MPEISLLNRQRARTINLQLFSRPFAESRTQSSHQFLLQPVHLLKTEIGSVVVSRQMKESVNQIETEFLK